MRRSTKQAQRHQSACAVFVSALRFGLVLAARRTCYDQAGVTEFKILVFRKRLMRRRRQRGWVSGGSREGQS